MIEWTLNALKWSAFGLGILVLFWLYFVIRMWITDMNTKRKFKRRKKEYDKNLKNYETERH